MNPKRQYGFTMLEMSIVLLIIATLAGGAMAVLGASVSKRQFQETQQKLQILQDALYKYRVAFDALPCPANITYAINATASNGFGIAANNAGTCTGGAIAANFASGEYVEGMVPVKTLGLPDEMAIDGWGRRIMYMVDRRTTVSSTFSPISATYLPSPDLYYPVDVTRIIVRNYSVLVNKSTKAMYVLLSMGPNGHGGYLRGAGTTAGAAAVGRMTTGSTNTRELNNCDCTSGGASDLVTYSFGTFVQAPPSVNTALVTDSFDDLVVFATRQELRTPRE